MEAANDNTQYLTAEEVSHRYRGEIAVRTLANWRCLGVGPRFVKIGGRILYRLADILEWERSRTANSTAGYTRTA